jgi:hypothetical protein
MNTIKKRVGKKENDAESIFEDPLKMLYIKPLGNISEIVFYENDTIKFKLSQGNYYYVPINQDTRIYLHNP